MSNVGTCGPPKILCCCWRLSRYHFRRVWNGSSTRPFQIYSHGRSSFNLLVGDSVSADNHTRSSKEVVLGQQHSQYFVSAPFCMHAYMSRQCVGVLFKHLLEVTSNTEQLFTRLPAISQQKLRCKCTKELID